MRMTKCAMACLLLGGCGSAGENTDLYRPPGVGGAGGAAGGPGQLVGPASPPSTLAEDAVGIVGVTSDERVIYRDSTGLMAIRLDGSESQPTSISEQAGTAKIHGSVVLLFTEVDWETYLSQLTIWTAEHGALALGAALYGESTALATSDGSWVLWTNDVQPRHADLVVATPDLKTKKTLIADMGRGSEDTCAASYGFVEQRVFVAWCKPGERNATLQRFDPPNFEATTLATEVNTLWSTDATADHVFYTDPSSGAWYSTGGKAQKVDTGVGWGMLLPDGSAILYTVGDQLRRAAIPELVPTPIIATQYAGRAAWSPDYSHSLYSTVVSYEAGTRRDLWLTPTDEFNPAPARLVDEPLAELTRSAFTTDGNWVLYLMDTGGEHKTLFVHPVGGGDPMAVSGVDTALAAAGSRVIFSSNRSDPETYPITADLTVMDPRYPGARVLLQTKTTDGRGFHLSPDSSKVVYVMPASPEAPSALYVQAVP